MTDQHEKEIIKKVLSGDLNAFTYLVDKYQDMAFTVAVRVLEDRAEAEDLVQEAFIKSYHALSSFKGDSKFSTWLYRIVYHKALDRLKQKKRKKEFSFEDRILPVDLDKVEDGLAILEQKERTAIIKKALEVLGEEEQVIISLYYFEESSLKEISEITGLTVENVKVKLFRSRKKLFSVLKNRVEFVNYLRTSS